MAKVLPLNSAPLSSLRSHFPSRIPDAPRTTARVPQSICVKVNSAVAMVLPPGVFITITPFSVAACTSMLSTPTPALPTALSFEATSNTSFEILVSLRTIIAETSRACSKTCSGDKP